MELPLLGSGGPCRGHLKELPNLSNPSLGNLGLAWNPKRSWNKNAQCWGWG